MLRGVVSHVCPSRQRQRSLVLLSTYFVERHSPRTVVHVGDARPRVGPAPWSTRHRCRPELMATASPA